MTIPSSTRRDFIGGTAAGLGAILAATSARAEEGTGGHEGHAGHETAASASTSGTHKNLIRKASECIAAGDTCVGHCIGLLGKGDTSLKDCLMRVQEMLPSCAALIRFAALDSPRLKELAKFCADVCDDCEKECKKHEKHHEVCKACMEACAACSKECRELIKA
jgi:Cys-rich four helix bundle protein (predicted Tat secretion target)